MSVYPFQWLSTHTVYRCVWCVYIVVTIYYVYCYGDVVLVCIRKLRESVSSLVIHKPLRARALWIRASLNLVSNTISCLRWLVRIVKSLNSRLNDWLTRVARVISNLIVVVISLNSCNMVRLLMILNEGESGVLSPEW